MNYKHAAPTEPLWKCWDLPQGLKPAVMKAVKVGLKACATQQFKSAAVIVKPMEKLQITNSYLLARLRTLAGESNFNSHTIRSKWNYQCNRELSFRVIAQYNTVIANPLFTSIAPAKGLNGDFLVTYLLHPGTAVYLGYNSNLQNPDPTFVNTGTPASVAPNRFVNDGRVAFIKVSYLFRY
jgi:hypothetical protein